MGEIVIELSVVVVLWCLGNVIGWASIRDVGNRPFNWRIIWPFAYCAWIDRRINDAEDAL